MDFQTGLDAVERLRPLIPEGATLTQLALRWILMFAAVTCAIPGAKNHAQAAENANASSLAAISEADMARIRSIYEGMIRAQVHQRW